MDRRAILSGVYAKRAIRLANSHQRRPQVLSGAGPIYITMVQQPARSRVDAVQRSFGLIRVPKRWARLIAESPELSAVNS